MHGKLTLSQKKAAFKKPNLKLKYTIPSRMYKIIKMQYMCIFEQCILIFVFKVNLRLCCYVS